MLPRIAIPLVLIAWLAAAQETRPVVLLGKRQLLEPPGGYAAFCKRSKNAKRSALRSETIRKLKKIASEQQKIILAAIGNPEGARSLWVVNAVVANLTDEQIKKAQALKGVRFVYATQPMAPSATAGGVAEVLQPPTERPLFTTKGKEIPWNLKELHVPEVWRKLEITGEGAVVAMLDAGANYRHADLRNNIWINSGEKPNNGEDDDGNGLVDDFYGYDFARMRAEVLPAGVHHGTFTSSVVAGDGTGGKLTGVAPRARLMLLQAWGGFDRSAMAFQYALEMGADVMNMSFSIPDLGETRGLWRLMAEHATAAGLVLVSGAGNFGRQAKIPVQIRIPEGIPCVICAGGVTKKRKVPAFVSKGPVEWESVKLYGDFPLPKGLVKPDVCAFPGPGIGLAAAGDEGYLPKNNGRRGNSLSSPHVAGICALMLSANPELTPWRVKEILEESATDIAPKGKDPQSGAGLVHAFKAVKQAQKG